jgi:hypothetical protein
MGLEGTAITRIHTERQTDGRTDEGTDGQTYRHKERKINTAKPIRAFWDYENLLETSDFSCIF